jgi:dipeptide/tripeptide permease
MQTVNAILILVFIPLFQRVVYPGIERWCILKPARKIVIGMGLVAFAFIIAASLEYGIEGGVDGSIGIYWQVPQYVVLTAGEVFFSITGLEFAYSQAPKSMKSMCQSAWQLTVAIGNLIVIVIGKASFL